MGTLIFVIVVIVGTYFYLRAVRRFAENAIRNERSLHTSADAGFVAGGDASYGALDGGQGSGFDGGGHCSGDGGGGGGHC